MKPYNNNILIIDDKVMEDVIVNMSEYFQSKGYKVDKIANPDNVRSHIIENRHKYSVIFIDYEYDFFDINGVDLCKIIREESPLSTLILCTGFEKLPNNACARGVFFDGLYEKEKAGGAFSTVNDYMEECLSNAFLSMNKRLPHLKKIPYDKTLQTYKDKLDLLELVYGNDEEYKEIHDRYKKLCGSPDLWIEETIVDKIREIAIHKEKKKIIGKGKKKATIAESKVKISRAGFLQISKLKTE